MHLGTCIRQAKRYDAGKMNSEKRVLSGVCSLHAAEEELKLLASLSRLYCSEEGYEVAETSAWQ